MERNLFFKPKRKKTKMKTIKLPENNLTLSKYRTERPTNQFCVIPNTKENRESIKHFNKLAKEQNSRYRLKTKFRCPKENHNKDYFGNINMNEARGLGIYIKNVFVENQYRTDFEKIYNLEKENRELKRKLNNIKSCLEEE